MLQPKHLVIFVDIQGGLGAFDRQLLSGGVDRSLFLRGFIGPAAAIQRGVFANVYKADIACKN